MTDLTFMNQAQMALQDAQAQKAANGLNIVGKNKVPAQENFADTLSAAQRRDPSQVDAMQRREIRKAAVEFESQFLSQMLQPMFEGLEMEKPFGGGHAEKMWQSMLVKEYGSSLAQSGGIGLADNIERQLLRLQEGND